MDLTLFREWMDEHQGYDFKTVKMYERLTRKFLEWFRVETAALSIESLNVISAGHIRDYRRYLVEVRQLEPSSVNKAIQAIRIFFKWALESEKVLFNPALRVSYIEEPLLAPKSINLSKENQIRAALKNKPLRTRLIIELGLSAGLRVSETVSLKISDVFLNDKEICFIRVRCGKGFKYRTVPITDSLSKMLKKYLTERKNQKSPFLFTAERTGEKISTRMVQKVIEGLRKEAGFHFTYHTLRHAFCFDLLKSGTALADVAVMAGHIKKNGMPNVLTTARYVLSRPEDLHDAVKQMENWRRKNSCGKNLINSEKPN